jgi:exonuclease III
MYAREMSNDLSPSRPSLERLNRKYDRIARALTAAVLCFEERSQYAWAIRAIDDWIEWSGRRPRKEAVASAVRVLAKRYRGQELIMLVTKVLNIPPHDNNIGEKAFDDSEYTYEKAIYTESINALHKSGLYEEADQLYAEGVTNGHLPWAVMTTRGKENKQLRLDLHGMSAAVAHSAVRVSLQKEIMGSSSSSQPSSSGGSTNRARDVLIITGQGRRSGERFRPVLRPGERRINSQ